MHRCNLKACQQTCRVHRLEIAVLVFSTHGIVVKKSFLPLPCIRKRWFTVARESYIFMLRCWVVSVVMDFMKVFPYIGVEPVEMVSFACLAVETNLLPFTWSKWVMCQIHVGIALHWNRGGVRSDTCQFPLPCQPGRWFCLGCCTTAAVWKVTPLWHLFLWRWSLTCRR